MRVNGAVQEKSSKLTAVRVRDRSGEPFIVMVEKFECYYPWAAEAMTCKKRRIDVSVLVKTGDITTIGGIALERSCGDDIAAGVDFSRSCADKCGAQT